MFSCRNVYGWGALYLHFPLSMKNLRKIIADKKSTLSMKCPIYEMSYLWIVRLWNVQSMKCSIYKMSFFKMSQRPCTLYISPICQLHMFMWNLAKSFRHEIYIFPKMKNWKMHNFMRGKGWELSILNPNYLKLPA